jgi:hypothetical protein
MDVTKTATVGKQKGFLTIFSDCYKNKTNKQKSTLHLLFFGGIACDVA